VRVTETSLLLSGDRGGRARRRGGEALLDAPGDVIGQDLGDFGLDAVQRQRCDVSRVDLGGTDLPT
jgi:hypothetical protein